MAALREALEANRERPESRYVTLVTGAAGACLDSARTVVFRGFSQADELMIATDTRSAKARHVLAHPFAQVTWYFALTRQQFRLYGPARMVDEDAADAADAQERLALWRRLSPAVRVQFAWPQPGAPFDAEAFAGLVAPVDPPAAFGLLLVRVTEAEWLDLRSDPPARWSGRLGENSWEFDRQNP